MVRSQLLKLIPLLVGGNGVIATGTVVAQVQQSHHGVTAAKADSVLGTRGADVPTRGAQRVALVVQGFPEPDDALCGKRRNYSHGFPQLALG